MAALYVSGAVRMLDGGVAVPGSERARAAVLRKDLRLELRAPQAVPAMALFSVTTLVVFHFALQRNSVEGELAAGVLAVTLLFAAMLGMSRLFVAEREEGGLDGFLLAPVDRTALLVAKALALLLLPRRARARRSCRRSCCCCSAPRSTPRLRPARPAAAAGGRRHRRRSGRSSARSRCRPARATCSSRCSACRCSSRSSSALARARRRSSWRRAQALPGRWLLVLSLYDLTFGLLAYALFDYLVED